MTKENLREIFGDYGHVVDHSLDGIYALLDTPPSNKSWHKIYHAKAAKYTTSGYGFDYNRMRYDAIWMMNESLKTDRPLSVKNMKEAFISLAESYEDQMHNIAFDASCHEDVFVDAQNRINYRADVVREQNPPKSNGMPLMVSFARLCNDLPVLEKMNEAKPFVGDLKVIRASMIAINQDQAEYNAYYAMIDDFKDWIEGKECRDLLSVYGFAVKTAAVLKNKMALVNN